MLSYEDFAAYRLEETDLGNPDRISELLLDTYNFTVPGFVIRAAGDLYLAEHGKPSPLPNDVVDFGACREVVPFHSASGTRLHGDSFDDQELGEASRQLVIHYTKTGTIDVSLFPISSAFRDQTSGEIKRSLVEDFDAEPQEVLDTVKAAGALVLERHFTTINSGDAVVFGDTACLHFFTPTSEKRYSQAGIYYPTLTR